MTIWDRGTYEAEKWRDDEVIVGLPRRARARPLRPVSHPRQGLDDPPHGPARDPDVRADAGARSRRCWRARGRCPRREGWAFEIKWDGVRAIAYCPTRARSAAEPQPARRSRRATPRSARCPPSSAARRGGPRRRDRGLRRRGPAELRAPPGPHAPHLGGGGAAAHARRRPSYVIFDLLYLDGALAARAALRGAARAARGARARRPDLADAGYHRGDGAALLEATRERGLEGIVAKRLRARTRRGGAAATG